MLRRLMRACRTLSRGGAGFVGGTPPGGVPGPPPGGGPGLLNGFYRYFWDVMTGFLGGSGAFGGGGPPLGGGTRLGKRGTQLGMRGLKKDLMALDMKSAACLLYTMFWKNFRSSHFMNRSQPIPGSGKSTPSWSNEKMVFCKKTTFFRWTNT